MSSDPQSDKGDSIIDYVKFWENPEIISFKNDVCQNVITPAKKAYDHLPQQLTDFKRDYVFNNFNQSVRMLTLGFSTIFVGLVTKKLGKGYLRVFRNSAITYVGLGLFFVPEVFNPYIHAPKGIEDCVECKSSKKE